MGVGRACGGSNEIGLTATLFHARVEGRGLHKRRALVHEAVLLLHAKKFKKGGRCSESSGHVGFNRFSPRTHARTHASLHARTHGGDKLDAARFATRTPLFGGPSVRAAKSNAAKRS